MSQKMDQFVSMMRVGLDSRSRPTAESCNTAIAVEENTSDSESTKLLNFYGLIRPGAKVEDHKKRSLSWSFTFFWGTSLAWGGMFTAWRDTTESNGADLAFCPQIQG